MIKKLFKAILLCACSSSVALASVGYKGEAPNQPLNVAPCPPMFFKNSPYIGLFLGSRNNYASVPAVFRGIDGNVALGYGGLLDTRVYIAAEVFGMQTWSVTNMPSNNLSVRSKWGWGVAVLPGFLATKRVWTYLRLGGIRTSFTNNVNVWGFQVGPGVQFSITPTIDLRGEYIYTKYNTVTIPAGSLGKPSSDVFNAGVVFKLF